MTTKLEAINTMLSCVGQAPINTLSGTKNAFTIEAETLLDSETKRVQLQQWDFNTEEHYLLSPDTDGYIKIPANITRVKIPQIYKNQYIVRDNKIYDKIHHTFIISNALLVTVIFSLEFDELPVVVQDYIKMCAAYKFTKRALGAQAVCIYTQEDLMEAKQAMEEAELDTGNYTLIPEMRDRTIRGDL
jgi:hypothetical protein